MSRWQSLTLARRAKPGRQTDQNALPWGWLASGLMAGALCTSIVFAPAHWLASSLASVTGGRLQLYSPQGTLWSGSAQLALGSGDAGTAATALPGRVNWTLRPGLGSSTFTFEAPCCLTHAWGWTAIWSGAGVRLIADDLPAATPARWPGSMLAGLGTPWNTLQLQGTLALTSSALQLQWNRAGWTSSGALQLDAIELSTRLSSLPSVGSYRLAWASQPMAVPTLELSTLQGSLQLQGRGQWVGGRLQFKGEAQASTAQEAALSNLLNIMGRREGSRSIITVG